MLCGVISIYTLEHGLHPNSTVMYFYTLLEVITRKGVVIYTPGYVVYTSVLTVNSCTFFNTIVYLFYADYGILYEELLVRAKKNTSRDDLCACTYV